MGSPGDRPFKFLNYQLLTVGYWPTVAMTVNGELGFDSGEGA
jgi:nitrate reductase NapE component